VHRRCGVVRGGKRTASSVYWPDMFGRKKHIATFLCLFCWQFWCAQRVLLQSDVERG
jgi:hypothetical protein